MEVIKWDVELSWVQESLLALFTIRPFDPALGMCCLVTLVAHHGNNGNDALHGTLDTVLPVLVVYNGEYTVVYKLQTYQLCAHCVLYSQFTVQCKTHSCMQNTELRHAVHCDTPRDRFSIVAQAAYIHTLFSAAFIIVF